MAQTTEDFGKFQKDGETRTAYSRADAVRFLFDGWSEVKAAKATPKVDEPPKQS